MLAKPAGTKTVEKIIAFFPISYDLHCSRECDFYSSRGFVPSNSGDE